MNRLKQGIVDSIQLKQTVLQDQNLLATVTAVTQKCIAAFQNKQKVFFCGNGGSAADAQHLAAELSGRFYFDRPPLYAEALHVNTSFLTAVANDYAYESVYARMLEAAGHPGDILFALSTSGNSPNILNAAAVAKKQGMVVVGMTGKTGGKLAPLCDFLINIPSADTPRIQEVHLLLGHQICEIIEASLFSDK